VACALRPEAWASRQAVRKSLLPPEGRAEGRLLQAQCRMPHDEEGGCWPGERWPYDSAEDAGPGQRGRGGTHLSEMMMVSAVAKVDAQAPARGEEEEEAAAILRV